MKTQTVVNKHTTVKPALADPILNRHLTASISNNNANILDVMNGDQRFDVSLDGTFLFHTTNLNAFF